MINPRKALQEALDEKGENIHPGILVRFFIEETDFTYPIAVSIKVLGSDKYYKCKQVVSKQLFREAASKKEVVGHVNFIVDAIARRIGFDVRHLGITNNVIAR